MNKVRKQAARKKTIAQKAATLANRRQSAPKPIEEVDSAQELLHLGTIALSNNEFATAVELLRQAIRTNPQNVDSFVSLGIAYANLGQHDFALAAYEMALQRDPKNSLALENRKYMLDALGLPDNIIMTL